jgi:hypothetical protein
MGNRTHLYLVGGKRLIKGARRPETAHRSGLLLGSEPAEALVEAGQLAARVE